MPRRGATGLQIVMWVATRGHTPEQWTPRMRRGPSEAQHCGKEPQAQKGLKVARKATLQGVK